MPNLINNLLFTELETELQGRDSILVLGLHRFTAMEAHDLRTSLAKEGITLRVVKNRIAAKALASTGLGGVSPYVKGQCGLAFGPEEGAAIRAAKVLEESLKGKKPDQRRIEIRAALLEGDLIPPERAAAIHKLPDKNTIRAMLLGVIQAPLRGLAVAIGAPGASLARALKAHSEAEGA